MSLRVYRVGNYAHSFERRNFEALVKFLQTYFEDAQEQVVVLGNYPLSGVTLGAMVLMSQGIVILEWCEEDGNVVACELGSWSQNGRTLCAGRLGWSPVKQLKSLKNKVLRWVREQIQWKLSEENIKIGLYFPNGTEIDSVKLGEPTSAWLSLGDMNAMKDFFYAYSKLPVILSQEELLHFEEKLNLQRFLLNDDLQPISTSTDYTSYIATATDFFEMLSNIAHSPKTLRERCNLLYSILRQATDARLHNEEIGYGNLFSKVEHLLREYHASPEVKRRVHDVRAQLRQQEQLSEEELALNYETHLWAVAQYIQLIYTAPIPESLLLTTPLKGRGKVHAEQIVGTLRVLVDMWDEQFIEAQRQDTGEVVRVEYGKREHTALGDWKYIKDLLFKGCQLNLVRSSIVTTASGDVFRPELIIYEPDYLVNISAIARCFEPYGTLPYLHLLHRLMSKEWSFPIALGNFSGQLLDEVVRGEDKSMSKSLEEYFHKNVLAFGTAHFNEKELMQQGERQLSNIHTALHRLTTEEETGKQLMVEPTFFSECLGIMGRMDLLQLDKRLLVEQKSGKGAFPSSDFKVQVQQSHYVQLNLYRALLHYGFGLPNTDIRTFFLYSNYAQGMIDIGTSPKLLFESVRVRNQMVWCDFLYAREGFQILDTLIPDKLRRKEVSNKAWEEWYRPKLAQVLAPIHNASSLEKTYFYRFLQFVQKELMHAKLGNGKKEDAGFASTWQTSFDQKVRDGNIFYGLLLQIPKECDTVDYVHFDCPQQSEIVASNFRKGDTVILYPYKGIPDACADMVFRAVVVKIDSLVIELELLNAQTSRKVFDYYSALGYQWAVEHDFLEATFDGLFRAVHALLTTTKHRKQLLLCQRKPEVDKQQKLHGEYGIFNELVLRAKQARDLFLVLGPPGTGKTSHGLLNIVQEELYDNTSSVLLLAYTNRAVDEICDKLIKAGIDFLRLGKKSATEIPETFLLEHRAQACDSSQEVRQLIKETQVFCSTTATLNGNVAFFHTKSFDLAVIDEASQLLEPQLLGILTAQHNDKIAVRRFVLIGDHKQLPAVVAQSVRNSTVTEPLLHSIGLTDCRNSLFERLYQCWGEKSDYCYMLTKQGRMHEDIATFPNQMFYQGRLGLVPLPHQTAKLREHSKEDRVGKLITLHRSLFISVTEKGQNISDKVNLAEAEMIADVVLAVWKRYKKEGRKFSATASVGVIVPYRNQIVAVRQAIQRKSNVPILSTITIDTVERFQGSQREVIVYGFTITKAYQLNFLTANTFKEKGKLIDRKLNVVMTRAQETLVLIGNAPLLEQDKVFGQLITFHRKKGAFFENMSISYSAKKTREK